VTPHFMLSYATMRCALGVLLLFGIFVTPRTRAQTSTQDTESAASIYLLRLERASYLQSVCVLLNRNGQYHLERHTPEKVRVFEENLDAEELRDIIRILSGDRLFNLKQKQIPDMMLKSDNDQVMLEIHRPGFWQELSFPDSASREPFRDAMDPLLKWFDTLNKRKKHQLSEEAGRNNCLPPSKPQFAKRSNGQAESEPSVPPPTNVPTVPTYILQMYDNRVVNFRTEVACLLVSTTGAYHLVKQSKGYSRGMNSAVLDGTLNAAELASLRALLDAPDLINQPAEKQDHELIFTVNSYFTRLAIPRGGTVQKIAAWKSYRIINNTLSRDVEDHETKLLAPLREWLKANINENNAIVVPTPSNPRCSPGE
jgi:hypothetical protein